MFKQKKKQLESFSISVKGELGKGVSLSKSGMTGVTYSITGIYASWNQARADGFLSIRSENEFKFQAYVAGYKDITFADPIELEEGKGFLVGFFPSAAQEDSGLVGCLVVTGRVDSGG
jgi:hypothetical protein